MNQTPTHTPGPWRINGYDSENGTPAYISGKGGEPILSIHRTNPDAEANAHHILRCVNAHEALVQALEQAKALLELQAPCTPKGSPMFNAEQGKVYLAIEQALAMARGQG